MTPAEEEARFWSRVEKTDTCWTWTGPRAGDGSGRAYYEGVVEGAHRIAWRLLRDPNITEEARLKCVCKNVLCVNPDHRQRSLTPQAIETIKALFATGAYRHGHLAEKFKVSREHICRVVNGRTSRDARRSAS